MIDDVEMDVDIDGNGQPQGILIFEGDFVHVCEAYLENEDETKLRLKIPREVAVKLVKEVSAYL